VEKEEIYMQTKLNLDTVYAPSEDVVAREVHGEFIIVPITSGIGDLEDEIFTLNETGRAIWNKLDGKNTLRSVAEALSLEFEAPAEEIEKDVFGLTKELLKRRMIIEIRKN
jgi:hypothetical protein